MNFQHGVTVEVHRAVRAKFGDVERALHHRLANCAVAPRYSNDANSNNSNRVIVGFSLYCTDPRADIKADDRIVTPWDGNAYDVEGEAAAWINPFTGWSAGVEAALRRVI